MPEPILLLARRISLLELNSKAMSIAEILDELPKLDVEERHTLMDRLNELEAATIEETPELLAAIDEGIRSAEEEGCIPLETVRQEFEDKWTTK
ncbi:MAG: hypothetical protein AAGH72_11640 [Verrucomicrobiota bacterium]